MEHYSQHLTHQDGLIETGRGHWLKNTFGLVSVTGCYILFFFLYFMTMYFGIWHQTFGLTNAATSHVGSNLVAVINSAIFSLFWAMMMWSHYVTMTTKPGFVPQEKEQLQEDAIPADSKFYDIIREREDIYHELVVKKKLKSGSMTPAMADEIYMEAILGDETHDQPRDLQGNSRKKICLF
jgi:hypothetical protein